MSSAVDKPSSGTRRPGSERRPHDAAASRRALLDAASALFDERGYDAVTVRVIAERAHVDAALIARYFGGKEGLYLATLGPQDCAPATGDPRATVEALLCRSQACGAGPVARAVVSPTLTEAMAAEVREIVARRLTAPLTEELEARGADRPALRAEVLLGLAIGLSLARGNGTLPALAQAPLDEVLAVLAPAIDALAT